jgi:general secretion pathway protein C
MIDQDEPTSPGDPLGPPEGPRDWKTKLRETMNQAREKAAPLIARVRESQAGQKFVARLREKFPNKIPDNLPLYLKEKILSFEPAVAVEWASQKFSKQGFGLYGTLATIVMSTFFLADLTALIAGKYIPEPPVARLINRSGPVRRTRTVDEYAVIASRNLFSSTGTIPGEEAPTGGNVQPTNLGGAPVKSTLPLNLIGTLILRDELRSIATIEDKSASMVYPVRVEDEIPQKAKITHIEPRRVIFLNTSAGRLEYIELPEEPGGPTTGIQISKPTAAKPGGGGIAQTAPNNFSVSRVEVDKTLSDLNNVLTQARAVPNFENGQPAGYKLFQIVPGSIYDKLGLQNGDVIAGLNGAPVNDPGKAFEMLSELKTANHLDLQVKRDGKSLNNSYDIH